MKRTMEENIFGTDGIRNIVGKFPFTQEDLVKLGHAIGQWASDRYGSQPCIAIAHDTRASAAFIKSALCTGLLLKQTHIKDMGMIPTPVAAFLVKNHCPIQAGIIITASHNPHEHNGIKIVDHRGSKINIDDEICITAHTRNAKLNSSSYGSFGTHEVAHDASLSYCSYMHSRFGQSFLRNKIIVLDCAHGATSRLAPHIFRTCGAEVISINNSPDGTNINHQCGALHPEALQKAVVEYQAYAGFAFDGDGDRLVAIDRDGSLMDGDDILAIISEHPRYQSHARLIGTIMSNQGLAAHAQQKNKQFTRTAVGEKNVLLGMLREQVSIGAEPSGHVIVLDHLESSDGIFAALVMLESIVLNNMSSMKTFNHYPQVSLNIPIHYKKNLETGICASIIQESKHALPDGRIVIRYSGTENLLRIMVEAPEQKIADSCAHSLSEKLSQELLHP